MRRYAERTSVPVAHTQAEIQRLLESHGASSFITGSSPGQALLMFELRKRRVKFLVPLPIAKRSADEKKVAGEHRRLFRALLLVLKAKLEAVNSGIVTFDTEFLPYIVTSGSTTVGEQIVPKLEEALEDGGRLPPLLLTVGGG